MERAAAANMFPANAIRRWSAALQTKSDKALPAAASMKAVPAGRNINTLRPTVLIRVRYRAPAAADNIPTASVRPGLTKGNTAAKNIIRHPAKPYVRKLMPTTATSVRTTTRRPMAA